MHNDETNHITTLKTAIDEGIRSGRAEDFDPVKHLEFLKATRNKVK